VLGHHRGVDAADAQLLEQQTWIAVEDLRKVRRNNFMRGRGPRARWLMSLYTEDLVDEFNRLGKNLVLQLGPDGTDRIWRSEVVVDEGMPGETESNAATALLAYGDLASYLVVLAGNGIRVDASTEYLFNKNQTCWRFLGHVDIKRKPVKTLTVLKTAAA